MGVSPVLQVCVSAWLVRWRYLIENRIFWIRFYFKQYVQSN